MGAERWSHFPHAADVGIRGAGPDPASAFEQAALALTAVITDLDRVRPDQSLTVTCDAPDLELLFYCWLNRVIWAMATERMLFRRFDVRIDGERLMATLWGEPVDRARHQPAVEPKGATFTELAVKPDDHGQWTAQCVVDV